MANETMFVASAVTFFGALGFFVYLHYMSRKSGDWLMEKVWLIGSFVALYTSLGFIRRGFQNYVVDNPLSDLTFSGMLILQWGIIALLGWLVITLMYHMFRYIQDAVTGKRYSGFREMEK